jgi:hypothetical protein
MREQIAVRRSQRQRVRGAVRESGAREVGLVDREPGEHPLEGTIDELHVHSEAAEHHVPCSLLRLRRELDDAGLFAERSEHPQAGLGAPARPMQAERERCGHRGVDPLREDEQGPAASFDGDLLAPGSEPPLRRPRGPDAGSRAEPSGGWIVAEERVRRGPADGVAPR